MHKYLSLYVDCMYIVYRCVHVNGKYFVFIYVDCMYFIYRCVHVDCMYFSQKTRQHLRCSQRWANTYFILICCSQRRDNTYFILICCSQRRHNAYFNLICCFQRRDNTYDAISCLVLSPILASEKTSKFSFIHSFFLIFIATSDL